MQLLNFCALFSLLAVLGGCAHVPVPPGANDQTPRKDQVASPPELYGELFSDVASSGIFPTFRSFIDAIPNSPPADIVAAYRAQRPQSTAALTQFVREHFSLDTRAVAATAPAQGAVTMRQHIDSLWPVLTRHAEHTPPYSSLLPIPEPYIVPGGLFSELYYWDSYFTMLGFGSGQDALRDGMLKDFAYLLHTYGHIPNGNRNYYLSRSQPPFFFKMVELASSGNVSAGFARFLPELKIEYAFWMDGASSLSAGNAYRRVVRMPDGSLLNRYWDDRSTPRDEGYAYDTRIARSAPEREPQQLFRDIRAGAESGWDFSSRWYADGSTMRSIETTSIIPIDLNSLLFGLERAIQDGCAQSGDLECAQEFSQRAEHRRAAVNRYLWNESQGVFDDYDHVHGQQMGHITAATVVPLFVNLATKEQAARVAGVVKSQLLQTGGLITTLRTTGEQWDAPNGWAPLQWMAIVGMRNYREDALAETIARRWIDNVSIVYRQTGKMMEKYNVVTPGRLAGGGGYALQDGFGWTNGVTSALLKLYPQAEQ